jgi:N-methylhydantoinase B
VLDAGLPTEAPLHAKLTMTLRRGQVFRHELPGSGGWGDPLSRELAAVARDLRDGLVSIEGAARDYDVVAHGDPPEIDVAATVSLRGAKRRGNPPPDEPQRLATPEIASAPGTSQ